MTRLEKIKDLKYQVQEIIISNSVESEKTNKFTSKLDESAARFNLVVADLEKAKKRLNEGEKVKARYRLDEEKEANFKRGFKEEMWFEEMRSEMRKKYDKKDQKAPVREFVKLNCQN